MAQLLRSDGGLANQLLSRAPVVVSVVLVVLIALSVANLLRNLAGPRPPPPSAIPASIQVPTRGVVDIASILRSNLFGQSVTVLDSSNAPVTTMPLVLSGVVTAFDSRGRLNPTGGFAQIGTTAADIKNYSVGGVVPGGARLHEVHQDRVLLDRSGAIEALLLPPRLGAPPPPPLAAATGAAPVQRVQQALRDNPAIINQIMSRSYVTVGNKLQGARVNPGSNRAAFDKLGLKPGDLVVAINGTSLGDLPRPDEVFNSLSNAAEAFITVERGGNRQDLHLNLAEIANEAERLAQGTANPGPGQPPGPDSAR